MGAFLFFYLVSLFKIPLFLCRFCSDPWRVCCLRNRCHQAQLEHRRNNEGRSESLMLFWSPPPLFQPKVHKIHKVYSHIHTHRIYPYPVHYGPPDMWKRGKQRWRAWWRSVRSCGWWRCCKARSRTWAERKKEQKNRFEKLTVERIPSLFALGGSKLRGY